MAVGTSRCLRRNAAPDQGLRTTRQLQQIWRGNVQSTLLHECRAGASDQCRARGNAGNRPRTGPSTGSGTRTATGLPHAGATTPDGTACAAGRETRYPVWRPVDRAKDQLAHQGCAAIEARRIPERPAHRCRQASLEPKRSTLQCLGTVDGSQTPYGTGTLPSVARRVSRRRADFPAVRCAISARG